ncbi:hypothetical protein V6N12_076040 [Hibiscus sabdariffa]|uniref:Uncharacterized protein n=1 Tax=Hibiscus sabdariffa TaxID=183260 RepID=A0ABR2AY27_9ROSI
MPELQLCLRSSPALTGCITHLAPQPSSRTCTIDATKIANSIIKEIRKRATIWHQISGGVERAAVKSEKTIKKRRLFVKVSTERPLGSGKRITITEIELLETCGAPIEQLSEDGADSEMDISSQSLGEYRVGLLGSN